MQQMNLGQMNITIYQIFLTLLLQHIIWLKFVVE
jgi:hypothetical protein